MLTGIFLFIIFISTNIACTKQIPRLDCRDAIQFIVPKAVDAFSVETHKCIDFKSSKNKRTGDFQQQICEKPIRVNFSKEIRLFVPFGPSGAIVHRLRSREQLLNPQMEPRNLEI